MAILSAAKDPRLARSFSEFLTPAPVSPRSTSTRSSSRSGKSTPSSARARIVVAAGTDAPGVWAPCVLDRIAPLGNYIHLPPGRRTPKKVRRDERRRGECQEGEIAAHGQCICLTVLPQQDVIVVSP